MYSYFISFSYYFGKDRCRTYINNITLQIFNLTEHNFTHYIIISLFCHPQLSGVDPFLIFLMSFEPKKHIEVVRGYEDPNNYYTFIGGCWCIVLGDYRSTKSHHGLWGPGVFNFNTLTFCSILEGMFLWVRAVIVRPSCIGNRCGGEIFTFIRKIWHNIESSVDDSLPASKEG